MKTLSDQQALLRALFEENQSLLEAMDCSFEEFAAEVQFEMNNPEEELAALN